MLQVDIAASKRDGFGKCAMRRLRASGNTPAVLYGNNKDVLALQLETNPFVKSLFQISRKNAVVNLSIAGEETRYVVVKEIQTDPVDDSLIHADFYEINLEDSRFFTVEIELSGNAKGLDLGGEMVVHHSTVQVKGLPLDVPDNFVIDVSSLDIGTSVSVSDIDLPKSLTMVSDTSALCVEIIAPIA